MVSLNCSMPSSWTGRSVGRPVHRAWLVAWLVMNGMLAGEVQGRGYRGGIILHLLPLLLPLCMLQAWGEAPEQFRAARFIAFLCPFHKQTTVFSVGRFISTVFALNPRSFFFLANLFTSPMSACGCGCGCGDCYCVLPSWSRSSLVLGPVLAVHTRHNSPSWSACDEICP